jgi:hypothetical protein
VTFAGYEMPVTPNPANSESQPFSPFIPFPNFRA